MLTWIALATLAQAVNAIIVLVDKYVLVSHAPLGKPIVYAFYISILSGFVIVLLPFGVVALPSLEVITLSFFASVTFMLSVLFLYTALKRGHASDAVPVVGAVSAVTALYLSLLFLEQDLPSGFLMAFFLLVAGTMPISHIRFSWKSLGNIVLSGIFFGCSAVLMKLIFLETTFLDGFFWSRMTNVALALLLLSIPANRKAIFHGYSGTPGKMKWLVVSNKALGGTAGVLTLFAISMGSVSVVNALAGLQFVFVFLFAYLFSMWLPEAFKGEMHERRFFHQLFGITCIVAGYFALFLV